MRKTLPTFYYLDHFNEFLRFFEGQNRSLLSIQAINFIKKFKLSDKNTQATIVRIANRKHPVIPLKTLEYEEICNTEHVIQTLREWSWITSLDKATAIMLEAALPKADLITVLNKLGVARPKSSLKKAELNDYFRQYFPDELTEEQKQSLNDMPFIVRQFDTPLRFLLFLYFGHLMGKLNQFSMRDLGVMRTRSDAVTGEARFDSEQDASSAFYYALQTEQLSFDIPNCPISLEDLPSVSSVEGKRIKNNWLYEAGRYFLETHRQWALGAWFISEHEQAQERWIREQYKDDNLILVENKLLNIIENGSAEGLLYFAEDFYARKFQKKRTSTLTDILRNATRCLKIDSRYNQQVEQGVVAYYSRANLDTEPKNNIKAIRTENRLWRSLFGLLYWPILYEQDTANLGNEFERVPPILKNNQLYAVHGKAIEALLGSLVNNQTLYNVLVKHAAKYYPKANSLFMWRSYMLEQIKLFLDHAKFEDVITHLRAMSKDYNALSDGYPDIMVIENEQLRFEEIKAPGDKLRRNQLVTLQRLKQTGFDVQITQVEWFRDPNQIYAVVDIETTGGKSEHNRITEIGVVKIQGGQIIDTWQSLINPQRHIPSTITRLTGISNDMVIDAPCFSDIAEELDVFTQDTIFVAHNVNFDLGFIKQEFARLNRHYRRPKLCTVQQCRRAFEGLASYSLANLTQHFGIEMENHHRALSDAKAAAGLLQLVLKQELEQVLEQVLK